MCVCVLLLLIYIRVYVMACRARALRNAIPGLLYTIVALQESLTGFILKFKVIKVNKFEVDMIELLRGCDSRFWTLIDVLN